MSVLTCVTLYTLFIDSIECAQRTVIRLYRADTALKSTLILLAWTSGLGCCEVAPSRDVRPGVL